MFHIVFYIKKHEKEGLHVDINLQNSILYRKLMSAYIFQYALPDEQETSLKEAIKDLKEKYFENK